MGDHRLNKQPWCGAGQLPQALQLIELTGIVRAQKQVGVWGAALHEHVHDDCAGLRQASAVRNEQHVLVVVQVVAAAGRGNADAVPLPGSRQQRRRVYVKLDLASIVTGDAGAQIGPPAARIVGVDA